MIKKLNVTCNSTSNILKAQKSTKVFSLILRELNIENAQELIWIFNKVKTLIPISVEEEQKVTEVIKTRRFKQVYETIKLNFIVSNKNKDNIEFENLLESFFKFIIKSRVIEILWKKENDIIEKDDKVYIKIKVNDKYLFLEVIEQNQDYLIWIDLRSWKYKLIDREINKDIFKTREKITFNKIQDIWIWMFLQWEENDYFCCNNFSIYFSKNSMIYKSIYATFIIDPKSSVVYQINKENNTLITTNIYWNILEIREWFLLYFINPIRFKWDNNEIHTTNWNLNLYSIEKNKDLIHNISLKYYKFIWNNFIALSYDMKTVFILDLKSKRLKEINIDDFSSINNSLLNDDVLFDKIVKLIKNIK